MVFWLGRKLVRSYEMNASSSPWATGPTRLDGHYRILRNPGEGVKLVVIFETRTLAGGRRRRLATGPADSGEGFYLCCGAISGQASCRPRLLS